MHLVLEIVLLSIPGASGCMAELEFQDYAVKHGEGLVETRGNGNSAKGKQNCTSSLCLF